jgi:hypothetical protein
MIVLFSSVLLAPALKSKLSPAEDRQPKRGFRLTYAVSLRQRPPGRCSDFHAEIRKSTSQA